MMEAEKRKHEDDVEASGKRAKSEGEVDDGGGTAEQEPPGDDEVEEFFAILKRIQVAVKYFQRRNGGDVTEKLSTWTPSFRPEDFEGGKEESSESQNAGLDLNSDPTSEVSESG